MKKVETSALPLIPVGAIILVRDDTDPTFPATVWEVFSEGKALIVDEYYPDGETEEVGFLAPADIYIVGFKPAF